jgi:hypothetical protein
MLDGSTVVLGSEAFGPIRKEKKPTDVIIKDIIKPTIATESH